MLIFRSFINFFFVPVIAMYLYYKQKKRPLVPDFKLLIVYCILVSVNIPVTRVITFIIRVISNVNIEADSSYYTIAAIVAAALIPDIHKALTNIIEKPIKTTVNSKMGDYSKDENVDK